MRRRQAEQPGREHAGESGDVDAEAEIEAAQHRELTPSVDTVSRSRVPARMRMPRRV